MTTRDLLSEALDYLDHADNLVSEPDMSESERRGARCAIAEAVERIQAAMLD